MKKLEGIRSVTKVVTFVAVVVLAKSVANHYVPTDVAQFRKLFVTLTTIVLADAVGSIVFDFIDKEVDSAVKQAHEDAIGMVG